MLITFEYAVLVIPKKKKNSKFPLTYSSTREKKIV